MSNLVYLYVLTIIFMLCLQTFVSAADTRETRCRCICSTHRNGTEQAKQLSFIAELSKAECQCDNIVVSDLTNCTLCKCSYETRNVTTIKVIVSIIVCIISLLLVYMLFLLGLDPLMARHRRKRYQEQMNEEDDQTVHHVPVESSARERANSRSLLNMLEVEQKKWVGVVQEQRRSVYDRHAMLN